MRHDRDDPSNSGDDQRPQRVAWPHCLDGPKSDRGQPADVFASWRRNLVGDYHSKRSLPTISAGHRRSQRWISGAAPEEVEQGILRPIEEAVRGVEGIREITSSAREGRGEVTIELVAGQQRMKVYQDIDQAVSRIRTFPDQIEQPEVRLQAEQQEVMQVALYGPIDIWSLRKLAEQLRDQLQAHDQITQVELRRVPEYVTHVEIPRERLREYGLTLPDIANIIRTSSQDVAAGSVQTTAGEILLRVKARKQWAKEFAGIEIVSGRAGPVVTLGDIATIRDGFEEVGFHSQFSQTPSVELDIYRVGSQSPIDVAEAVGQTMREFESVLPPGVKWRVDSNNAEEFRRRLTLVSKNALMAAVIVLVILALFLEIRLAFWVMMGMVVAFIGGILLLPVAGVSINMISLFGFLVVLGIVVDDAVVVGENVYEKRQTLIDNEVAAVEGHERSRRAGDVQYFDQHRRVCAADVYPGRNRKILGAAASRRDHRVGFVID